MNDITQLDPIHDAAFKLCVILEVFMYKLFNLILLGTRSKSRHAYAPGEDGVFDTFMS